MREADPMHQHVPAWLGTALPDARAGHGKLALVRLGGDGLLHRDGFRLRSAAFEDGEELDPSFTAAEDDAVAPPLEWTSPPAGTGGSAWKITPANRSPSKPWSGFDRC